MTASNYSSSHRIHNIVEYIKCSGNFLCDIEELSERGIQNILQEDFDIYQTFTTEELQQLTDELQFEALENEVREAKRIFNKANPCDEGEDLVHSEPKTIYESRTTYKVYYNYPVDENLRKLPKISYPLKPCTQREMNYLVMLTKLLNLQNKVEKKAAQSAMVLKML